jgi:Tfp pilus assembly protein PilO
MDKNRLWIIGSVLVMAIVVGLGWFLAIAPQLASAAAADAQRAGVEQANAQHEATLARLKKDYANLGALNGQLASLSESVPSDTAMPAFVNEINAIAASAGVTITGFSVADAKPYAPVSPPAVAAPAGATPSSTATPSPSATPAATPTPAPTPVAGMPPVTSPKLTSANFSSLAVTLNIQGDYQQILSFVNGVQSGKRLFLVSGITTTGAAGPSSPGKQAAGSENATISGLVYVVIPGAPSTSTPAPAATSK